MLLHWYWIAFVILWYSQCSVIEVSGFKNDTCVPLILSSTCRQCLTLRNTLYCPRAATCFYIRTNDTLTSPQQYLDVCDDSCDGRILYSSDQCNKDVVDYTALVFSFILLILCPLCIISGCLYMIAIRCRSSNKIAVDGETVAVVTTAGFVVPDQHVVPVMATAQVIRDEEAPHIELASLPTIASSGGESRRVQSSNVSVAAVAQEVRAGQPQGGYASLNSPHRYAAVPTIAATVSTASPTNLALR